MACAVMATRFVLVVIERAGRLVTCCDLVGLVVVVVVVVCCGDLEERRSAPLCMLEGVIGDFGMRLWVWSFFCQNENGQYFWDGYLWYSYRFMWGIGR